MQVNPNLVELLADEGSLWRNTSLALRACSGVKQKGRSLWTLWLGVPSLLPFAYFSDVLVCIRANPRVR